MRSKIPQENRSYVDHPRGSSEMAALTEGLEGSIFSKMRLLRLKYYHCGVFLDLVFITPFGSLS